MRRIFWDVFFLLEDEVNNGGDNIGVIGFSWIFLVIGERVSVVLLFLWNGGVVWVVIEIVRGDKKLEFEVFV